MFRLIDKLVVLFVILPPLYMAYRFVRWWMRQEHETEQEAANEPA